MGYFTRSDAGANVVLNSDEATVLGQVMAGMIEIIGPPDPAPHQADGQAWARELGLGDLAGLDADGPADAEPPDPVRARLFPDGYRDDPEAAHDFRRFTEDELRATKSGNLSAVIRSLPEGGGQIVLDEEGVAAWLGALNDARLTVGTILDVGQGTGVATGQVVSYEVAEEQFGTLPAQRLMIYHWLGELQGSLLEAVTDD